MIQLALMLVFVLTLNTVVSQSPPPPPPGPPAALDIMNNTSEIVIVIAVERSQCSGGTPVSNMYTLMPGSTIQIYQSLTNPDAYWAGLGIYWYPIMPQFVTMVANAFTMCPTLTNHMVPGQPTAIWSAQNLVEIFD